MTLPPGTATLTDDVAEAIWKAVPEGWDEDDTYPLERATPTEGRFAYAEARAAIWAVCLALERAGWHEAAFAVRKLMEGKN